jgi:glycine reductase
MVSKDNERILGRCTKMKKAILYVNQFFGQIGGEDKADFVPEIREGLVGPAMELNKQLDAQVTHTIICGDNFMGSNEEEAVKMILGFLEDKEFDIFFAGPAFQAGRYGNACGVICKAVKEKFNVPVISSMHIENPGVEMFKKEVVIFPGGKSAAAMRKDIKKMATYANKILNGEKLGTAEEEGYFLRGIRHQYWLEDAKPASERVVEMLLKKINGEEFKSELPIPKLDRVEIAPPIKDLSKATIAFATTGGIVPVDNPDRIQSASATRWGRYSIEGMERLEAGVFKTIHAGFDPAAADADPNVIVPIDSLRVYEKEGKIGKLHEYFYTTVGTGTTQAEASRMGKEMVEYFKKEGVDAVILSST